MHLRDGTFRLEDDGDGYGKLVFQQQDEASVLPIRRASAPPRQAALPLPALPQISRVITPDRSAPPLPSAKSGMSVREVYAAVDARLAGLSARGLDHGAGGDCFFRSLCGGMGLPPDLCHLDLRRLTVQYMWEHRERFSDFIPGGAVNFIEYCEDMGKGGTYINGEIEIRAAAEALNLIVEIYGMEEQDDRIFMPAETNGDTRQVRLVHYAGVAAHYRELVRVPKLP